MASSQARKLSTVIGGKTYDKGLPTKEAWLWKADYYDDLAECVRRFGQAFLDGGQPAVVQLAQIRKERKRA